MGLGAIVVVGAELENIAAAGESHENAQEFIPEPLACVDVLGRSMLERMIERFVRSGVEVVSVIVPEELSYSVPASYTGFENVQIHVVSDVGVSLTQKFVEYASAGIEHSFVASASLYTETDLLDLFYFHREARQPATRAVDELPLEMWVVDCALALESDLKKLLRKAPQACVSYVIRDYVSRMTHPRDVRRFVSDALRGRCAVRPSGVEVKPGIWIEDGAELHRRARIVAPAYIGRNSKVMEDTLVTRCSNIETGCCIDYGTVVEDSSILTGTQVGIWLDVCHAVASGNKLFNLERDVRLEIADGSILRSTTVARHGVKSVQLNFDQRLVAAGFRKQPEHGKESPRPEAWQFGTNPIQG